MSRRTRAAHAVALGLTVALFTVAAGLLVPLTGGPIPAAGKAPAGSVAAPAPPASVTADLARLIGADAPSAATNAELQRTLHQHSQTIDRLTRNGNHAIAALNDRRRDLAGLRRDVAALLRLSDRRSDQIRRALRALPTVEREATTTVQALHGFAAGGDPLVRRLDAVAGELAPTVRALHRITPSVQALLGDLGPLIRSSRRGLPAITQITGALRPALEQLDPLLGEVNPALRDTAQYPDEIPALLAHASTVTQVRARGADGHRSGALRTLARLQPDPPVSLKPKDKQAP